MATARNNLYQLIDQLPDAAVHMAEKVLQAMVTEFPSFGEKEDAKTKLMRMLATAPIDDEPTADDDRQTINDARNNIPKGEGISLGDFKKELDI